MPTDKQAPLLVILGAGGHARVVADAALAQGAWSGVAVTTSDGTTPATGDFLPGVPHVAPAQADAAAARVHVAIGDAVVRARESARHAARLASVVHPQASVSPFADLAAGCFVAAQAVVGPCARLGQGAIVNHGAVVDHDAQVGDWSHVAPGASLGGAARIGARVLVGAGARVLPGVSLADDVTLGAGAVATAAITAAGTYAGVPARRLA